LRRDQGETELVRTLDHLGQRWRSSRNARERFSWIMQSWLDLRNVPIFHLGPGPIGD